MIIFLRKNQRLLTKILTVVMIIRMLFPVTAYGEDGLQMYSGSYALTDANTGRLLTGKNAQEPMANASTTKILTCIVALENSSSDEMVEISGNAAAQPKVHLGVKAGEVYPLRDMLYALMLESYNDCAVAIAEHVAGSVEDFADMMNKKAAEIGCENTYFLTPNGLDKEENGQFHHTTAQDLCRIMAYCVWESPMKETFLEITQTRQFSGSSNGRSYTFVNRNSFLDQMDGVLSGKTGFTSKAGYCYVAAFEKDGERYCIALLACGWPNNKTYKWKDATKLLNYGMTNYENQHYESENISEQINLDAAVGDWGFEDLNQKMALTVEGICTEMEVLLKEDETIEKEVILYTDTELPIEEGQLLGVCNVYLKDELLQQIPLLAQEDGAEWTFINIFKVIYKKFLTIF